MPTCRADSEVYTRIVGYYRPVSAGTTQEAEYKDGWFSRTFAPASGARFAFLLLKGPPRRVSRGGFPVWEGGPVGFRSCRQAGAWEKPPRRRAVTGAFPFFDFHTYGAARRRSLR